MSKTSFIKIFVALSLLTYPSAPIPSVYAIMQALSTDELITQSEVIIRGKVLETKGVWTKNADAIVTHVYINVIAVLRGALQDNTIVNEITLYETIANPVIVVECLGGEADGVGMGVSDVPEFRPDEEVILFLKSQPSLVEGIVYIIIGNAQGKYTIDDKGLVHKEGFTVFIEKEEDKNIIENNVAAEEFLDKISDPHVFISIDRRDKKQAPAE